MNTLNNILKSWFSVNGVVQDYGSSSKIVILMTYMGNIYDDKFFRFLPYGTMQTHPMRRPFFKPQSAPAIRTAGPQNGQVSAASRKQMNVENGAGVVRTWQFQGATVRTKVHHSFHTFFIAYNDDSIT